MTLVTLATYSDGTLQEQLTDAVDPAVHLYFDTDGVTVLSSVPAVQWELDILRNAATPAATARPFITGSGDPTALVGAEGDMYVNTDSNFTFGPKSGGVWPVGATVQLPRA